MEIKERKRTWLSHNWYILLICMVSVLLCMVFYLNGAMVTEKVNDHWVKEWESKCYPPGTPINRYEGREYYPVLNISEWST